MTRKKILKHLIEWQSTQIELDDRLSQFYFLTGSQADSPLLKAIYAVAEAHTDSVALIVGDKDGWLDWWKFENDYGAKAMSAALAGGNLFQINSLDELAGLIAG